MAELVWLICCAIAGWLVGVWVVETLTFPLYLGIIAAVFSAVVMWFAGVIILFDGDL